MVVDASGPIPHFHFLGFLCFGGFQGIPDDGFDLPHFKGFGQIVIGAPFHGLNGCGGAGVGRDQDDDCIRMQFFTFLQYLKTVNFLHPDIGDHQIKVTFLEKIDGLTTACRSGHLVAFFVQHDFQKFSHAVFVVNDKDVGHGGSFSCHGIVISASD